MGQPEPLQIPGLNLPGVVYGFGAGRVSLGWKQDPPTPETLGARLNWLTALGLDPAKAVVGEQVHGGQALLVQPSHLGLGVRDRASAPPGVDGLVCALPGVALSVTTADCLPVLLAAPGAVAALHCGWRSLHQNLLENAWKMMTGLGVAPGGVTALLGPCIQWENYEVGEEFTRRFPATSLQKAPGDRWRFGLQTEAKRRLLALGAGEGNVHALPHCTFSQADRFFSNRREGGVKGLLLSTIALAP